MKRPRRKGQGKVKVWQKRSVFLLGASALALLLLFFVFKTITSAPTNLSLSIEPSCRKAAIVDQTALTQPNPEFIREAVAYLIEGGFDVDVYQGQQITVEFFRTLPPKGYELILFRTHSTNDFLGAAPPGKPVYLYTGEHHDRYRYTFEQLTLQIMAGKVLYEEDAPPLFIIGPKFVRQSMVGNFDDTLIIIGGCDSLSTSDLAQAFLERDASTIVGWNGLVDLSFNDKAILYLLRLLARERVPLKLAVERTILEIGADPTYKSTLTWFP